MVVAIILMVGSEVVGLIPPLLLADPYDAVVNPYMAKEDMRAEVRDTMILIFIIHFGGMFLGFLQGCILGVTGERVVARLRMDLYSAILQQEIGFFDQRKSGEL